MLTNILSVNNNMHVFMIVTSAQPACCSLRLFPNPLPFTLGPNTYHSHFLMSKSSSTGGTEEQLALEQPDTLGLQEDSE
jgi:hypothetical protein